MNVELREHVGDVAAHDDEVALGEILDVHHAPYERQPVGGHGEYGADQHAVQKQLDIVQHGPPWEEILPPPAGGGELSCAQRAPITEAYAASRRHGKPTSTAPRR